MAEHDKRQEGASSEIILTESRPLYDRTSQLETQKGQTYGSTQQTDFFTQEVQFARIEKETKGKTGSTENIFTQEVRFENETKGKAVSTEHLTRSGRSDHEPSIQKKIHDIFVQNVNPAKVLNVFWKYDRAVLDKLDMKITQAVADNSGQEAGAEKLLEILSRYDNWLPCLIQVLKDEEVGLENIAEMILQAVDEGQADTDVDVMEKGLHESLHESLRAELSDIKQKLEIEMQKYTAKEREMLEQSIQLERSKIHHDAFVENRKKELDGIKKSLLREIERLSAKEQQMIRHNFVTEEDKQEYDVLMEKLKAEIGEADAWKMPLELFTTKKQDNVNHKPRKVRKFYKSQNKLIKAYENILSENEADEVPAESTDHYDKSLFYSKITLLVNVLLTIAKAVASALSGSLSIISSLVDSCLDLLSGSIMWWASHAVKYRDPYYYPQGRTRLEPVAVIILAVVMGMCSVLLIREGIQKIIDLIDPDSSLPIFDFLTLGIAGSTVVIKLILWLVCRNVNSSIVQALAQDHRNDVFSNSVAIVCGYLGSKDFRTLAKIDGFSFIDPIGAILISLFIIFNWWMTGSEQIKMLTGYTAKPSLLSKLAWVCINHHPAVLHIETLRAFHFGNNFLVEVDIVLPWDMILREAHEIGESLQQRLENMPEVERAFVHLDFEFTHSPKSEHKVV